MAYEIILFDLDDTLIDNRQSVRQAFSLVSERRGLKFSEEDFERWYVIDKTFWKEWQDGLIELPDRFKHETGKKSSEFLDWLRSQRFLRYFDNAVSSSEAVDLNNLYMTALAEKVLPVDGAEQTLAYLSNKYRVVVGTNGPLVAAEDKVKKIGCLGYVEKILSAEMFGYMKPRVEFFDGVKSVMGQPDNDKYLIVGDSLKSDIGLAMNCKVDGCWFNRRGESLAAEYKPAMTVRDLTELIERL